MQPGLFATLAAARSLPPGDRAPCNPLHKPCQVEVHLLVPPDSGMYNFWVTMVLAVVGQAVGLLWVIYQQIK
jgi:meckelin